MAKYRKKPVIIEAMKLEWTTWNEMCDHARVGRLSDGKPEGCFLDENGNPCKDGHTSNIMGLMIPTLEGLMIGKQGDFIIRGVKGELYACNPDIFEMTYEVVDV